MAKPSDMQLVGRDGEILLYASEDGKTGVLYDSIRDIKSKPQPLQVFFKWGNFEVEGPEDEKEELEESITLVKKRGAKAADEPPPNVRGKPLPEEEATEGWEITEEDIAEGQAWVDKAMKEAGFRD